MVMAFRGSLTSLPMTFLCGQFLSRRMLSSWGTRVHSLGDGSRIRIALVAEDEIVSWRAHLVPALNCFLAVNESLMLEVAGQLVDTAGNPLSSVLS